MNRYFKIILSVILPIIILFGGTGCMNQIDSNKDLVKEKMYSYACEKYNQSFDIVNYEYALRGLDANRRDILKIKDINGIEFYVFHYTDDKEFSELYDDYPSAIVDNLFANELKMLPEYADLNYELTVSLDLGEESLYYEDVNDCSLEDISNRFNLFSITLVINYNDSSVRLEEQIDKLYDCYTKLSTFNFQYIDFEVIRTTGSDRALEASLSNIRIEYENDWNTFHSVDEYISVWDEIVTFDEFKEMIVEV